MYPLYFFVKSEYNFLKFLFAHKINLFILELEKNITFPSFSGAKMNKEDSLVKKDLMLIKALRESFIMGIFFFSNGK